MAKHHKKTSRRRTSRKHRRSSRKQHGGSCAAYPLNRDVFAQRGGMAPFTAGDNYLLDAATRVQAEVAPLDKAFAELPSVMPRQAGGRRRRSMRRNRSSMRRRHSMRRRSHRRKTHRRRQQQRGGMAPFGYEMALPKGADAAMNPQFQTEGSVNPLYGEFKGAQTA
jgi:hypothetical protein